MYEPAANTQRSDRFPVHGMSVTAEPSAALPLALRQVFTGECIIVWMLNVAFGGTGPGGTLTRHF